jgi:hypothetical protein
MRSPCHPRDALALVSVGLTLLAWGAPAATHTPQVPTIPVAEQPTVEHFPTALAALEQVLRTPARVLAFGEYHQTTSTTAIRSSLSRFIEDMLPRLARSATDLVVETWGSTGACGAREAKVDREVETTTERPAETESEIVTLLKRAKAVGMQPHILAMSCADYRYLTDKAGKTDFVKMLKLTRKRLQAEVVRWLGEPSARAGQAQRIVAIYGGALHNDLHPTAVDKPYAFGPALYAKARGQYLEVDLFVPEYIAGDQRLASEPWFRLFAQSRDAKDALLIRRSERSYVIIFPPSQPRDTQGSHAKGAPP